MREKYSEMYSENATTSAARCAELIEHLHRSTVDKDYACPGGYTMYRDDMRRLKEQYDQQTGKGILAHEKWNEFMTQQADVAAQILNADESLEAADKEREENRRFLDANERMMETAKEAERKLEQILRDQERNFQQQMEDMIQKMEQDKREREREFEVAQEARQREQQRLVKEGLDQSAKLQMETVKIMKEEQQRAAKEAEENRKMFERLMEKSNEQRKEELQAMRDELMRSAEQNKVMSDQLQQIQDRPQSNNDGSDRFHNFLGGIVNTVATAFISKLFPVPLAAGQVGLGLLGNSQPQVQPTKKAK